MNAQNSIAFLYTHHEHVETKSKNTTPLTIASREKRRPRYALKKISRGSVFWNLQNTNEKNQRLK